MSKPSKSRALYERNMDLQKASAEITQLTEQRDKLAEALQACQPALDLAMEQAHPRQKDHWQQQALSKSELVAALEARCRELEAHADDVEGSNLQLGRRVRELEALIDAVKGVKNGPTD